jgi:hypothetical protein
MAAPGPLASCDKDAPSAPTSQPNQKGLSGVTRLEVLRGVHAGVKDDGERFFLGDPARCDGSVSMAVLN